MIQVRDLIQQLEDDFNETLASLDASSPEQYQPFIADNGIRYRFRFVLNASDYKHNIMENGKEIRFIHCEFVKDGSEVEGEIESTISLDLSLNILVPILNSNSDQDDSLVILDAVDALFSEKFSKNSRGYYGGYAFGAKYTLLNTGEREQRIMVGDSVIMTAMIEYFFVALGVNSSAVLLQIDGEYARYIKLGRRRQAQQENGIPSDSGSGEAEFMNIGSVFSLTFNMPVRMSNGTSATMPGVIRNFIEGKELHTAHLVTLSYPSVFVSADEDPQFTTINKAMIFEDVSDNYETVLNGSMTVNMSTGMKDITTTKSMALNAFIEGGGILNG